MLVQLTGKQQDLTMGSMRGGQSATACAAGGQLSLFKLPLECQMTVPKWGKAIGWSVRDDAMLLVGKSSVLTASGLVN